MTRKELSQLYFLNKEIEQNKRRLEELEAIAEGCTAQITGMPHATGVHDKIGDYSAEIADLRDLIALNMQRCWYELNKLERYIQSIDDSQMRQILTLRYINGLNWQQVAFSIGGGNTANGVQMAVKRFLKKNKSCY